MSFLEKAFLEEGFSLDRLRRLMDVEKHGYIAKAAGGDRVRANQISRQIGELEKFFGREFRKKEGKLSRLNQEGLELAEITKNFFRRLGDFQERLDGERPAVVIGAGQAYIESFLIPKLPEIKKSSGDIGINLRNLRSNQIIEALESEEIDFGVLSETKKIKQRFNKTKLLTFGYELVVPKNLSFKINKNNALGCFWFLMY